MLRSKYVAYSTQTDGNKDENGGILVQPGVVTETPKWAGHNVGCYKLTPKVNDNKTILRYCFGSGSGP